MKSKPKLNWPKIVVVVVGEWNRISYKKEVQNDMAQNNCRSTTAKRKHYYTGNGCISSSSSSSPVYDDESNNNNNNNNHFDHCLQINKQNQSATRIYIEREREKKSLNSNASGSNFVRLFFFSVMFLCIQYLCVCVMFTLV